MLLSYFGGSCQTATNFTCNDCDGINHDLFSVLDQNKVVILIWVMPCGQCILPSKTAYNIYKSYQTSHPDKVLYYLCDDMANNTCPEIQAWASTNKFLEVPVFSDTSISMFDYGEAGMPKIVILAGSNHKVYNVQENTFNTQDILDAIDLAIEETSGIGDINSLNFSTKINYDLFENTCYLSIKSDIPKQLNATVYNAIGQIQFTLFSGELFPGENTVLIEKDKLSKGAYIIRIQDELNIISEKFIVY